MKIYVFGFPTKAKSNLEEQFDTNEQENTPIQTF